MAEAEEDQQHPVLAAFGNPLLDIIVPDEEGHLVDTFRLQRDIAQEVDTLELGHNSHNTAPITAREKRANTRNVTNISPGFVLSKTRSQDLSHVCW